MTDDVFMYDHAYATDLYIVHGQTATTLWAVYVTRLLILVKFVDVNMYMHNWHCSVLSSFLWYNSHSHVQHPLTHG